jgi:hypothetical protein
MERQVAGKEIKENRKERMKSKKYSFLRNPIFCYF